MTVIWRHNLNSALYGADEDCKKGKKEIEPIGWVAKLLHLIFFFLDLQYYPIPLLCPVHINWKKLTANTENSICWKNVGLLFLSQKVYAAKEYVEFCIIRVTFMNILTLTLLTFFSWLLQTNLFLFFPNNKISS
jgi:hypothetical protein